MPLAIVTSSFVDAKIPCKDCYSQVWPSDSNMVLVGTFADVPGYRMTTAPCAMGILVMFVDMSPKKALNVQILEFGEVEAKLARRTSRNIKAICPELKALVIVVDEWVIKHFNGLFNNLKYLYLRVHGNDGASRHQDQGIRCAVTLFITTLQLEISSFDSPTFMEDWNLPVLEHLIIKSSHWVQGLDSILQNNSQRLLSLHIDVKHNYVDLPADVWAQAPSLMYCGLTATYPEEPLTAPHPGHPIHTLGMLEVETPELRKEFIELIRDWKSISTIADCHTWAEMPEEYDPFRPAEGFDHTHDESNPPCWRCVQALHAVCLDRGLEYEDHAGITYNAFLKQTTDRSGSNNPS